MLCFYEREKNETWAKFFIGSKIQLKIFDTWNLIQLFHYIVAEEILDFVGFFFVISQLEIGIGCTKNERCKM